MNTPSHLLIGAAVFAKRDNQRVTFAAMVGGVVPDLPLMLMVAWSLWVTQIPTDTVFGQLYFSDAWQRVFSIDHGFLLWGALFGAASVRRMPVLKAFAGAGLLHAGVDFLVHHDDARAQFWPISNFVFHSPVSYYDRAHFGGIMAPLEAILDAVCAAILVRRLTGRWQRAAFVIAAASVVLPVSALTIYHGFRGGYGMGMAHGEVAKDGSQSDANSMPATTTAP